MKLVVHKRSKVTAPDFSKKIPFDQIWAKRVQNGPKWPNNGVFGVLTKILPIDVYSILLKMKYLIAVYHSAKTACSGKIWFLRKRAKSLAKDPKMQKIEIIT